MNDVLKDEKNNDVGRDACLLNINAAAGSGFSFSE